MTMTSPTIVTAAATAATSTVHAPSPSPAPLVLVIDNYDSFTFNIVQYLCQLGARVLVHRNDEITIEQCVALNPTHVVISPGPGNPSEAGISKQAILTFAGRVPVLGVCLGHQSIIETYGGEIVRAPHIMHGKTSRVWHDNSGVFRALPDTSPECTTATTRPAPPFHRSIVATRYHSLVGNPRTLPACLRVTAFVEEKAQSTSGVTDEVDAADRDASASTAASASGSASASASASASRHTIMGVRHRVYTVEGVQFHPESVCTESGMRMLGNFLALHGGAWKEEESGVVTGVAGVAAVSVPIRA